MPHQPRSSASPRFDLAGSWRGALLLAWVAALYLPSLLNGFAYDDDSVIREASSLLDHPSVRGLFTADYFRLSGESTYRPIVTLTYLIDWKIAGAHAWMFHVQNLLWHLVAVGCLLLLLGRLGASAGVRYGAAALYGVHPALTEAVDSVGFREDVLVTSLGLLGLLITTGEWPRRRGARLALASLCFGAAMLSKETAVVYALLLPLTLWAIARARTPREAWAFERYRRECIAIAACTLAYLVIRFGLLPAPGHYGNRVGDSLASSLATGLVAIGYYVRLLVYPYPLCADYRGVITFATSVTDWRPWVSLAAMTGLTSVAWWMRTRNPLAPWGWVWFLVCLAPVSNVIPIPTFMAERFLHLPLVGAVVFVVGSLAQAAKTWGDRSSRRAAALTVVAFVTFSALTWTRQSAWSSNETLWRTTLDDYPTAVGALHGYGTVLADEKRYTEAIPYLRRALQGRDVNNDRRAAVLLDLGVALALTDQNTAALDAFRESEASVPTSTASNNLGNIYYRLGRFAEAEQYWREALRLQPGMVQAERGLEAIRAQRVQ